MIIIVTSAIAQATIPSSQISTSGSGRDHTFAVYNGPVAYAYDGAGKLVKKIEGTTTTVYIKDLYEKNLSTGEVIKYYYANGQRVAMRKGATLYYLHNDHLGG